MSLADQEDRLRSQGLTLLDSVRRSDRVEMVNPQPLEARFGLPLVRGLRPLQFKHSRGRRRHFGFDADQVQQCLRSIRKGEELEAAIVEECGGGKYVRNSELVPVLVKAVHDLSDRLRLVESDLKSLKLAAVHSEAPEEPEEEAAEPEDVEPDLPPVATASAAASRSMTAEEIRALNAKRHGGSTTQHVLNRKRPA